MWPKWFACGCCNDYLVKQISQTEKQISMASPTGRASPPPSTGRASPQSSRMPKPSTMPRLQVRADPEMRSSSCRNDSSRPQRPQPSTRPPPVNHCTALPPARSPVVVSVRVRVPTGGMARGCHAFAAPGRPKAAHDRRGHHARSFRRAPVAIGLV